jgi:hypothetical protein
MLILVKDAERPCAERKVLPSTTGTVIRRAASTREKCPPWQCFITATDLSRPLQFNFEKLRCAAIEAYDAAEEEET